MTKPIIICEDNMLVVLSSSNPRSTLQHKSIASSCHHVREHVSGEVVEIRKVESDQNLLDALTKGLDSNGFHNCIIPIMFN